MLAAPSGWTKVGAVTERTIAPAIGLTPRSPSSSLTFEYVLMLAPGEMGAFFGVGQ